MLSREENELLTQTGPGTSMGEAMRRYWIPALLAREIAGPDGPPVRVRLLGEDLVAFRDSDGRIGLLDEYCPHEMADASPHPTTLSRPTLWLSGSSVSRAPATTLSAD